MQLHYDFNESDVAQAFADELWEAIDRQYYVETEEEWSPQYEDDTYESWRQEVESEQYERPIVTLDGTHVQITITPTSHNMIILASMIAAMPLIFPIGKRIEGQDAIDARTTGFYVV